LNGSKIGLSRSNASCRFYAKSYARGSEGFQEATLLADFTPRAMLAAVRAFKKQRFLPILRHERVSKYYLETKCKMLAAEKDVLSPFLAITQ
jgi:hypothetical protein